MKATRQEYVVGWKTTPRRPQLKLLSKLAHLLTAAYYCPTNKTKSMMVIIIGRRGIEWGGVGVCWGRCLVEVEGVLKSDAGGGGGGGGGREENETKQ